MKTLSIAPSRWFDPTFEVPVIRRYAGVAERSQLKRKPRHGAADTVCARPPSGGARTAKGVLNPLV